MDVAESRLWPRTKALRIEPQTHDRIDCREAEETANAVAPATRLRIWETAGPLAMRLSEAYNVRSSLLVRCGPVASCQHAG